jgi:nucleotide-binding universal stress UspA family protein
MKTIAVLTDFSARAEHACRYALGLAKKIKANVLLFNSFLVPADVPMAAQVAWPTVDYNEIKKQTERNLAELRKKLEHEIKNEHQPGTFLPAISWQCEEGAIANNIPELEENRDIALLVMATHGTDQLSAFMFGNNCRNVIDTATLPLLIIPETSPLDELKRIVFATDVTYTDVQYIKALAEFAKQVSAEITISNVNPDNPLDSDHDNAVRLFMNDVEQDVDYDQINFRSIPNGNVKKGLEWLLENAKFDMLVMVHRKSNLFELIFKSSITKKIADRVDIPLLVYPYPATVVPLI